jgi:hypothetical protein
MGPEWILGPGRSHRARALQVEALVFVCSHAPLDHRPLAKIYDVRLGGAENCACEQYETDRRKEEKTTHPASLSIRKCLQQGQAGQRRMQSKPGLSARNLLAASSETADSSRDTAALRNDNSLKIFKLHRYDHFRGRFASAGNRLQ